MTAASPSVWTDALIEEMVRHWAAGKSGRTISNILAAQEINVSRNAIVGKLHRLGHRRAKETECKPMPRKPTPLRPSVAAPRKPKPVPQPRPVKFVPQVVEISPLRLPLLDLEPGQCRYECSGSEEAGGYLFCGLPVKDGSSYCSRHHAVCWVKPHARPGARPFPRAAA